MRLRFGRGQIFPDGTAVLDSSIRKNQFRGDNTNTRLFFKYAEKRLPPPRPNLGIVIQQQ
jgi:hypothetical protein